MERREMRQRIEELERMELQVRLLSPEHRAIVEERQALKAELEGITVEEGEERATAIQERERAHREACVGEARIGPIPTDTSHNPYMTIDRTAPCSICHTYCYGDCQDQQGGKGGTQ